MRKQPETLRLDCDVILERNPEGGYARRGVGALATPSLSEVVSRARVILKRTRDDLAVIDHSLAQKASAAKRDLYLDKRKRRQDAERFLADFLGWAARTTV